MDKLLGSQVFAGSQRPRSFERSTSICIQDYGQTVCAMVGSLETLVGTKVLIASTGADQRFPRFQADDMDALGIHPQGPAELVSHRLPAVAQDLDVPV